MNISTELMINENEGFICFQGNLSREDVTNEVWSLKNDQNSRDDIIVTSTILLLFVVVGVPLNLAVLVALIYNKFFKQPSTFLLFNLALVDLLTCALVMPFQAVPGLLGGEFYLGGSDYIRCQSCRAGVILIVWLLYMSIHIIAVMSVDRLIYIKRPIEYEKWITVPRMAVVVVVLWIYCFILTTPPLFQFGAIEYSRALGTCTTVFRAKTRHGLSSLYITFLLVVGMIPVGVLVVSNIWLLCFAVKVSRLNQEEKQKYHDQQLRMLKIFGSIFVSNFVTWAPAVFVIVAIAGVGVNNIPPGLFSLLNICFLLQSVIHPMLETCLVKRVRKLMKTVFCLCCRTRKKFAGDIRKTSTAAA